MASFDPERRLVPMLEASTSPALARAEVEGAIERSGATPGIFHGEEDRLEVRWVFTMADGGVRVLNVEFGDEIELYVFDRQADEIIMGSNQDYDLAEPGAMLGRLVDAVRRGDPAEALWGEVGCTWGDGAPPPRVGGS